MTHHHINLWVACNEYTFQWLIAFQKVLNRYDEVKIVPFAYVGFHT